MYFECTCIYAIAIAVINDFFFFVTLFSKKCKERKQNDRGALYENTEMKTSSDNKYVTLTTDQPPVPLYETPHTLTDEIKLKFNKKDKHPYANEKPKKQKKPDTKVKSYANINFRKGKNSDCFIRVVDILSLFQIFYYRYLNFITGASFMRSSLLVCIGFLTYSVLDVNIIIFSSTLNLKAILLVRSSIPIHTTIETDMFQSQVCTIRQTKYMEIMNKRRGGGSTNVKFTNLGSAFDACAALLIMNCK